jgi:uncharacterized membrane protein YhfC
MENTGLLTGSFILAGMFNVLFPLALGWWIVRKQGTSWKLLGVGVLTFIGSQIFHLPAVSGLTAAFSSGLLPHVPEGFAPYFNAIVLGLLAGLFEETARWIGYKILKKSGDSLGASVTLGVGHGGIEAIFIGGLVLVTLISMLVLKATDLESLPLPAQEVELMRNQMTAYWTSPWYLPLAGAVERIGALMLHISLSIMVWLAVSFRKPLWFWIGVLYHAVVDGAVVLMSSFEVNLWLIEAFLIVFALGGLLLMLRIGKQKSEKRKVNSEKLTTIPF